MRCERLLGRMGRLVLAGAVIGALFPASGEAQLGGLVKKAKAKLTGDEKPAAAESSPAQRSPYNEYVLELKPDVADCLEKGLAAENAELEAFKAWASKVKSEDDYQACAAQMMMTPEAQALTAEYQAGMQKGDQAAMQAMKTFSEKAQVLLDKQCGPKPNSVDEKRDEAKKNATAKGAAACGYTERQYIILKERITPFCGSPLAGSASEAVKLPGEGRNIFWVYSATEVEVLKGRCPKLQTALKSGQ
jgi:hypothetical protein